MDYTIYMNILDKEVLTKTRGKIDWFLRKEGKLVPVIKEDVDRILKALEITGEKGSKHFGFSSFEEAKLNLEDESIRISVADGFLEWKEQQKLEFEKEYNYEINRYQHAIKFGYQYFTIYNTENWKNFSKTYIKTTPHIEFEYGDNTYVVYIGDDQDLLDESIKEEFFRTLFEYIPELRDL